MDKNLGLRHPFNTIIPCSTLPGRVPVFPTGPFGTLQQDLLRAFSSLRQPIPMLDHTLHEEILPKDRLKLCQCNLRLFPHTLSSVT